MQYEDGSTVFSNVFAGVKFHKHSDVDGKSVYVAKVRAMSTADKRDYFILATNFSPRKVINYGELVVKSVQSRKLPENFFRGPDFVWNTRKLDSNIFFLVTEKSKQKGTVTYSSEQIPGAELVLLLDAKKKDPRGGVSVDQYPNKISLLSALETFRCIIQFNTGSEFEFI